MNPNFPKAAFLSALLISPLLAEDVVQVKTAQPVPAPKDASLQTTGRTAPAQEATLYSRATGTISELKVDIGDRVQEGDILAIIDAPEVIHGINAAKARVEQMKARQELAEALLKRGASLAESNAFSKETLDERRSSTRTATADVLAAEAELSRLEETQRFLTIRAPFRGTITARRIDKGDHINGDSAGADAWLFQIARLNELRMILYVPPATALQIKKDDEADVTFADIPGKTFAGKVTRYSNLIDSASGTMRVELLLPNSDFALPAGLSGIARVKAKTLSSVLMVPSNAIATRDGVTNLALVENGKVKFQPVRAGRTLGPKIEVLSGISPEGQVILSPNALLREGDAVNATPLAAEKKGS
jgi:RND family efflux transporter MFP subunit